MNDNVIPLPVAHPVTEVDLTSAAEWLIILRDNTDMGVAYAAALGMWSELLGAESDHAALDYAETLHAALPARTIATLPPF